MRTRMIRALFVALPFFTLSARYEVMAQSDAAKCISPNDSQSANSITLKGVRVVNLHEVDKHLYRSAQPPDSRAFHALNQQLGIDTVLNLRTLHSDLYFLCDLHRNCVAELSPFSERIDPGGPTYNSVVRALGDIRASILRQRTVLVHCEFGSDRTGLIVALYRILYQHWCREAAITEMKQKAFGFHVVWTGIERFILEANFTQMKLDVADHVKIMDPPDGRVLVQRCSKGPRSCAR